MMEADSHGKFRDWCRHNGYEDLADWPDDNFPLWRLAPALEEYNAGVMPHPETKTLPTPRDMTLQGQVADEIDRAAGVVIMMSKRLAMRVKELKARDGMTAAVRRYATAVVALQECSTTMIASVGDQNSVTYEKHRQDRTNDTDQPRTVPQRSGSQPDPATRTEARVG